MRSPVLGDRAGEREHELPILSGGEQARGADLPPLPPGAADSPRGRRRRQALRDPGPPGHRGHGRRLQGRGPDPGRDRRPEDAAGGLRTTAEEMVRRFRSEIRLARKVSSRNVCRIHEYGIDGDLQYISMEWVDGVTIRELLQETGALPVDVALDIADQIVAGLAAIHDAGIMHRDLKPSNVMRTRAGVVKLMDFGIAKADRRGHAHRGRPGRGHAGVHEPRAGDGSQARPADRRLHHGDRHLRAPDGSLAVPGGHAARGGPQAGDGDAEPARPRASPPRSCPSCAGPWRRTGRRGTRSARELGEALGQARRELDASFGGPRDGRLGPGRAAASDAARGARPARPPRGRAAAGPSTASPRP